MSMSSASFHSILSTRRSTSSSGSGFYACWERPYSSDSTDSSSSSALGFDFTCSRIGEVSFLFLHLGSWSRTGYLWTRRCCMLVFLDQVSARAASGGTDCRSPVLPPRGLVPSLPPWPKHQQSGFRGCAAEFGRDPWLSVHSSHCSNRFQGPTNGLTYSPHFSLIPFQSLVCAFLSRSILWYLCDG